MCTMTKINAPQLVKYDKSRFKRFTFLDRRGRRIKRHEEFGRLVSDIVKDGAIYCRSTQRRGKSTNLQTVGSRDSAQGGGESRRLVSDPVEVAVDQSFTAFDHASCEGQHRMTKASRHSRYLLSDGRISGASESGSGPAGLGRRTRDLVGETSHTELGNAHHDSLPRMRSARSNDNRVHSLGDRRTFSRLGTSPATSRPRDTALAGGSITPQRYQVSPCTPLLSYADSYLAKLRASRQSPIEQTVIDPRQEALERSTTDERQPLEAACFAPIGNREWNIMSPGPAPPSGSAVSKWASTPPLASTGMGHYPTGRAISRFALDMDEVRDVRSRLAAAAARRKQYHIAPTTAVHSVQTARTVVSVSGTGRQPLSLDRRTVTSEIASPLTVPGGTMKDHAGEGARSLGSRSSRAGSRNAHTGAKSPASEAELQARASLQSALDDFESNGLKSALASPAATNEPPALFGGAFTPPTDDAHHDLRRRAATASPMGRPGSLSANPAQDAAVKATHSNSSPVSRTGTHPLQVGPLGVRYGTARADEAGIRPGHRRAMTAGYQARAGLGGVATPPMASSYRESHEKLHSPAGIGAAYTIVQAGSPHNLASGLTRPAARGLTVQTTLAATPVLGPKSPLDPHVMHHQDRVVVQGMAKHRAPAVGAMQSTNGTLSTSMAAGDGTGASDTGTKRGSANSSHQTMDSLDGVLISATVFYDRMQGARVSAVQAATGVSASVVLGHRQVSKASATAAGVRGTHLTKIVAQKVVSEVFDAVSVRIDYGTLASVVVGEWHGKPRTEA